jgi:hypothetical protein
MRLLIDDTEQPVIMTCSCSCTFVFELGRLNKIDQKNVLPQWPRRKEYDLVSERIIQKYFEARDYKVEVLVYPFSLMNWPFPSSWTECAEDLSETVQIAEAVLPRASCRQ